MFILNFLQKSAAQIPSRVCSHKLTVFLWKSAGWPPVLTFIEAFNSIVSEMQMLSRGPTSILASLHPTVTSETGPAVRQTLKVLTAGICVFFSLTLPLSNLILLLQYTQISVHFRSLCVWMIFRVKRGSAMFRMKQNVGFFISIWVP